MRELGGRRGKPKWGNANEKKEVRNKWEFIARVYFNTLNALHTCTS